MIIIMNINDYPDDLRIEEQTVLNKLISKMNKVIDRLDQETKDYIARVNKAILSHDPDERISLTLAHKGFKDTEKNKKPLVEARDELYQYRLLLRTEDSYGTDFEEFKVGLRTCMNGAEQFVISWKMPVCRHYLLDNSSIEFDNIVTDKFGDKYHTHYTLLVKNEVKHRFDKVMSAINLFPGIIDDKVLLELKGKNFFSDNFLDMLISHFNPDEYNPDEAAKIISDEFLQELLERRSTPEFKNIVFSIQKKQGEIIQAPYDRNMIVQGCAGSGKSMIMLHRLPILLYDNPTSLSRTNLYVITPSQMYIQLAENMRHQLEISDIKMGTIEQYYDYCIEKYPGFKPADYGKINSGKKISHEDEQYIFSSQCVEDIQNFYDGLCRSYDLSLEKAYSLFSIKDSQQWSEDTYERRISNRLLKLQSIIRANEEILIRYYNGIKNAVESFNYLGVTLRYRKMNTLREIDKRISRATEEIRIAKHELEKLDPTQNADAIKNRENIIEMGKKRLDMLTADRAAVEADEEYFSVLLKVNEKLEFVTAKFKAAKQEFSQYTKEEIYAMIDNAGSLIGTFYMISWELSKIDDKYKIYLDEIKKDVDKVEQCISVLQTTTDKYLDYDYYQKVREENEALTKANSSAIKKAYEFIMGKVGCSPDKNGSIRSIKYSPYIYLQTIFQFKGAPTIASKESLLAIDEAQGMAPEEIRLLRNINANRVIMNLYGDIYQHIEGTKGVDSWDDFKEVIDFDSYEIQENYRNASQITNYCNRTFGMNMNAINTPGKGVHEISTDAEFQSEVIGQLLDSQRAGIGAILVGDDKEAKYLMNRFSSYGQKFHDMTGEEFSIHRTRWNIMNINDAKGLEFSSVIVLSGRMTRNQRYIAYTRALDDLYVYSEPVDINEYGDTDSSNISNNKPQEPITPLNTYQQKPAKIINNEVKQFFEEKGIEVIDKRAEGGRLWVIGDKEVIRDIVNEAIAKFNISGKYMSSKESNYRNAWCTKTDK